MKILLAVDGSMCSDAAVAEVARRPWPTGSEVKIISAAELPALPALTPESLPPHYAGEIKRAARDRASALVANAAATLRASASQDLQLATEVIVDSPKDAIIEEAERWHADLIMVGSHGYRGYERSLLGSVSQAVASQARCSVEIVRCPKTNDSEDA
jgi:nucleotide-binding universal stress UspA family protein